MKKPIITLVSICLSVILLAACGGTPAANTAPDETGVLEAPATPQPVQSDAKVTETAGPVLAEGEVIVSSFEELQTALNKPEVKIIRIGSAIDLTDEISFERNDDLEIHVDKNGVLTVNGFFTPVGCAIINDGSIIVNKNFERGITTLTNNGSITVKSGGLVSSGMSDTHNHGTFTVEEGGELHIERGSIFNNFSQLINNGKVTVSDGGQLNDEGGSITNDGTIDLNSFFNGDLESISGDGTLNDNRE